MNLVSSVQFHFSYDTFVDSSREYITAIIVGMLSDKVDTSGRCEHFAIRSIQGLEFLLNSRFHFHNKICGLLNFTTIFMK